MWSLSTLQLHPLLLPMCMTYSHHTKWLVPYLIPHSFVHSALLPVCNSLPRSCFLELFFDGSPQRLLYKLFFPDLLSLPKVQFIFFWHFTSTITFLNCNVINWQKGKRRGDSLGWRVKIIINIICETGFSKMGRIRISKILFIHMGFQLQNK